VTRRRADGAFPRKRPSHDGSSDSERRFGQRKHLEPGLQGRKSPSIASMFSSDEEIAEEDELKFGMVQTAGGQEPFKMTVAHSKLLILISKYGQISLNDEPETWIRETPLLVLIYEGIVAGVFEMDYSPLCMTISHGGVTRRMFMNISQDSKSCIDELRENNLIAALKISSEDFQVCMRCIRYGCNRHTRGVTLPHAL